MCHTDIAKKLLAVRLLSAMWQIIVDCGGMALAIPPHGRGHSMSIGPVNRPQENQATPLVRSDSALLNQFRSATRTAQAGAPSRSAETANQTSEATVGGQASIANAVAGKQSGGNGSGGDGESQQHKQDHNDDDQSTRTVLRNGEKLVLGANGEVIRRIRLNEPEDVGLHFNLADPERNSQQIAVMYTPGPYGLGAERARSYPQLMENEQSVSEYAAKLANDFWPDSAMEGVSALTRFLRAVLGSTDVPVRSIHVQLENLKTTNPQAFLVFRQALMTVYGDSQPPGAGRVADILAFLKGAGAGDRAFTIRVARRLIQSDLSIASRNASKETAFRDAVEEFLLDTADPSEN